MMASKVGCNYVQLASDAPRRCIFQVDYAYHWQVMLIQYVEDEIQRRASFSHFQTLQEDD